MSVAGANQVRPFPSPVPSLEIPRSVGVKSRYEESDGQTDEMKWMPLSSPQGTILLVKQRAFALQVHDDARVET